MPAAKVIAPGIRVLLPTVMHVSQWISKCALSMHMTVAAAKAARQLVRDASTEAIAQSQCSGEQFSNLCFNPGLLEILMQWKSEMG